MSTDNINLMQEKFLEIAVLEISKALSSTLNLEKVLNLAIDLLEGLINYSCALIALKDLKDEDNKFIINLTRYIDEKEKTLFKKEYLNSIVSDISENPNPVVKKNNNLQFKIKKNTLSLLLLPLYFEGRPIGFMYFEHPEDNVYSNLNMRTIAILSNQIAIAIKNAQLFENVQLRVSELKTLYEISRECALILETTKIYDLIADFSHKYFGCDYVFIWIYDNKENRLKLARARGIDTILISDTKINIGSGMIGKSAKNKIPVFISNLQESKLLNTYEIKNLKEAQSIIIMPLVSHNILVGILSVVSNTQDYFSKDNLRVLSILSSLFSVAIHNTQLYETNEMLAITDGLTEIYNHRFFQERLDQEIKRTERYEGNISVAMFDIDNFKQFNDKFGHAQGDSILKEVSILLKKNFRETDFIARYGGEEFVVILPQTDILGALVAAERYRVLIENYKFRNIKYSNKPLHLTISGGVCSYPKQARDKKELLKKVDAALYKAKELGKNKICMSP